MARNTKTVRKRFDYRQCDDFAAYLNHMARQGWHFKEWRAGLVFEKGAPENAVYTVEIFTDGTAHDMQPSYKAMNFAEYCEAAGWKLIDQRVKWCVLKRTREDAVPIFTDEERFENVKSVTNSGPGKLLWAELLLLIFMIGAIFYNPKVYLFSPIQIHISLYWPLTFLHNLWQTIDFRRWCKECEARLDRGEPLHFRHARRKIMKTTLLLLSVLVLLLYLALTFDVHPVILLIIFSVMALLGTLPGRFRMDAASSQLVSALSSSMLIFFAIVFIVVSSYHDMKQPDPPVSISVFRPGETAVTVDRDWDTTPFGSNLSCYLYTEEDKVSYFVYESQYHWVLDTVWNQEVRKVDQQTENCADAWGALDAFRTAKGRYVIRYEDRILILKPGPEPLSQDQIATIVAALKEG
jgi:hypothetical protein